MAYVLGITSLVWAIHFMLGYLDPSVVAIGVASVAWGT